jgi:hypothetical protein
MIRRRKLPEMAQTPQRRVHALLGCVLLFRTHLLLKDLPAKQLTKLLYKTLAIPIAKVTPSIFVQYF